MAKKTGDPIADDMLDILARKRAPKKTAKIVLDTDPIDRRDELQKKVRGVETELLLVGESHDVRAAELREQLDELKPQLEKAEAEAEAVTVPFVFQGIGRKAVSDLMAEYPPTAEQRKAHEKELKANSQSPGSSILQWDEDRFPAALIAASSHSPKITFEQALEMYDSAEWTRGDLALLWLTAWNVQERVVE